MSTGLLSNFTVSRDQWALAGLVVSKVTHHNLMSTYYVSMPTWQTVFPGRGTWNFTKSCWQLYCESCSAANVRKIQLAKINYSFSSECWMQGLQLHISAVFMLLCSSVLVMSDNKKPMDKLLIATTDNFVMKYLTSFYQWKIVFLSCKVKIILIC